MHNLPKRFSCLLLIILLLSGMSAQSLAETVTATYNYKVKSNTTLYVRSTPSTELDPIGKLSGNTRINVTETTYANNRNWGKITYNNSTAWVCIDYCERINSLPVSPDIPSEMQVDWTVIDISTFQRPENFDWNAAAAAGVKGVIIRIGGRAVDEPREIYDDESFMTHYNNAIEAGLYVGVYFFSYALSKTEAEEEAAFVIDTLKANNCKLLLPVFIDIEDYEKDMKHRTAGTQVCDTVVNTFCDMIENAGYYPGVYCNLDYTRTLLSPSVFNERAVWIAHWDTTCDYSGTYHMWQYTDKGYIDGYPYRIDISRCYMNFPKLITSIEEGKKNTKAEEQEKEIETYGEHIASEWKIKTEAACNVAGERIKVCTDSKCGKTVVSEIIQPSFSSHNRSTPFVSLVDTDIKVGTTLSESQKKYLHPDSENSIYGIKYSEVCEKNGGVKLTYCKTCKTVMTVSYYYKDACEHTTVTEKEVTPSCTTAGIENERCTKCNKVVSSKLVSPTVHNSDKVNSTATCSSDGEKSYSCSKCGITVRTEFSPKTYHNFTGEYKTMLADEYDGTVSVQVWCTTCSQNIVFTAPYGGTEGKDDIDINDARNALRNATGLEEFTPLQKAAADIDMDGKVTVSDARYILRFAIELEDPKVIYNTFIKLL